MKDLFFQVVHEYLRYLRTSGLSPWVENTAALAVDNAVPGRPAQSVQSVAANLVHIVKMQFFGGITSAGKDRKAKGGGRNWKRQRDDAVICA